MTEDLLNFKMYYNSFRRRIILNNYYSTKINDGKSIYAALFDWISTIIIVVMVLFIVIISLTKSFLISTILTAALSGIYVAISITWHTKTNYEKIKKVNEEMANMQVLKDITKYGNRDFLLFIKDLLEKYYNTNFFEYDKYIDFIGEINGEIYAVKCYKNSMENKIFLKDLEHFLREVENKDIKDCIIVTSSSFADEVKEGLDYILIDFEQIKRILKDTGSFPTDKEIEELIISKYDKRREDLKNRFKVINKNKLYRFIVLGISLIILSNFVEYELYYKTIGILSISIGIAIGIYTILKRLMGLKKYY